MNLSQPCSSRWLWCHRILLQFPLLFFLPLSLLAQPDPVILGSGNTSNMNVSTSDNNGGADGFETVNGNGMLANEAAASRFLSQATLGADLETIQATTEISFSQWIEDQFDTPQGFSICDFTRDITIMSLDSTFTMGNDPNNVDVERWYWHTAWWQYTMTSPDVLRNRVALGFE